MKATRLESSHGVERVDATGHPLVADGARTVGSVGSSGPATQSLAVSLGQASTHLELRLFLQKGAVEVPLGYGDFLGRIEKLKALPLKNQR